MRLDGRVALVLGASRGIGAATGRALAASGATVVLAARNTHPLERLAGEITSVGGAAFAVQADASDPTSVEQLVTGIVGRHERLDIAVNNAAASHPQKPLVEVTLEEFDEVTAVNLRGLFVAVRAEIRAMLQVDGGAIVNVASTAALRGVPGVVGYSATKHAVVGLTKVAALDYATAGVRVNAVAPGPILTDRLAELPEAVRARVVDTVPMRRLGAPDDVAQLIAWLASDEACFITGAIFSVDGGRLAGGA